MLAKLTSKNQITIPKKVLSQLPKVEYFEVDIKEGGCCTEADHDI